MRVWRSIASVTAAGEAGRGMLAARLEDLRARSRAGVLLSAEVLLSSALCTFPLEYDDA